MKIAVCTPRCGPPSWHYHDSMVRWQIYHDKTHPDVNTIHMHPARALPIDVARNMLARQFLQTDADYLWFLDQDAAWLPGTLDRLLSHELPIVGALEMMRLPGCCWPMALRSSDKHGYRVQVSEIYAFAARHLDCTTNEPQLLDAPPDDSLLLTGFTGCHCLLIERGVLAQMGEPWFQGYDPGGEDQFFCEKAAGLGIPTHVDMSVVVGHASTDRITGLFDFMSGAHFLEDLEQAQTADAEMTEWMP